MPPENDAGSGRAPGDQLQNGKRVQACIPSHSTKVLKKIWKKPDQNLAHGFDGWNG
jgi:hypothetical protein